MISSDIIFGIFFIFQTCISFIGNSLSFTLYMYNFLILPHKKKPVDVILTHVTLASALMLIFGGIPNISFGIRLEMGNTGCKTVLYIRGLPRVFICVQLPSRVHFRQNTTDDRFGYQIAYCKNNAYDGQISSIFLNAVFIQDLSFLSLMTCSSIYMVNILYRHHNAAQKVRSTIQFSSHSAENKATHVILILMSCFVFFYWTNTFITIYLFYASKKKQQLEKF
ncbi:unnamed protein product [Nyctereutes procyonoides]|uniref:Vomeronasal type-1 receptor n=1 Tax=Nyctereutes procyonoides TaxID=34880 RepID=A0A811ZKI4_NYCPR|nr:unnamed protein product [Nyctereutes procyonoides]